MCGIAGSFGDRDLARVRRMTDALLHRGPDSSGYHGRGEIHLGARRLSVLDLGSGDQPIYDERGDKAIVFNGEIYNYRELRDHLRSRGHVFATRGDTEVVLHLYEEYGRDCVHHLRGMFAFAIEDGGSLFLARDRLGIKPLYYAHLAHRGLFLFASEIKALLRCAEVGSELDRQAIVDSLMLTHLVGSGTLFRDVRCLEPGCTLEVRRDGDAIEVETRRYYLPTLEPDDSITLDEAEADLHRLLEEAVRRHLVADVEVALLLSGGLDSGLLAAMMHREIGSFRTFTSAVDPDFPDLVCAQRISTALGVEHEVVMPSFEEYLAAIPHWIHALECLTPLSGLSLLLLSRRVGEQVKVCLCGEGSDEIFGGYDEFLGRFRNLSYYERQLPRVEAAGLAPSPEIAELVGELHARRKEGLLPYLHALFRYHQRSALVRHHLETFDKLGMSASLEFRVPFLDHELVDYVNRLPIDLKVSRSLGSRKYVLRRVALDRHSPLLTDAALRTKLGMPSACNVYKRRLNKLCADLLPADYADRHELGPLFPNSTFLVLFELFETIFVEHRGEVPPDLEVVDFIRSRGAAAPARAAAGVLAGAG